MHLPNGFWTGSTLLLLLTTSVQAAPVDHDLEMKLAQQPIHLQVQTEASLDRPIVDDGISSILRPSRYESTVLGRRLLALSKSGVLTTVFPENITSSRIPSDVARTPIGLPEYIASCEESSGNPTVLSLTISTSTLNANAGSNVSLSLSWWDEYIHLTHHQPWSAANLPRLSLVGYLEEIPQDEANEKGIPGCFTRAHGDSVMWLPGKKWAAHQGLWTRIVVKEVYWIGGFGDRNYIGWFDPDEWHAVTSEEWEKVKLPGEK
ncbi:hypothetical protein LTR84_007913 [Exophiala bonariae]|uniref:CREG-like beta-barrel domain-containing protein n=1 Tax=Exophiala bonariae TaxID=1690606 RepID=A0AAV9NLE3_9EURO|nr:hypothetical protein LTR84_007913 [Exophiala bonariae]